MAGVKISALPPASMPLGGNEQIPFVQSGITRKVTVSQLFAPSPNSLVVYKSSLTGSAFLPAGTTGERDAVPAIGCIRYNVPLQQWEGFGGSGWIAIGARTEGVDILFTPYSTITSTNVQYAIQELSDETVHKTSSVGSALLPVGTDAQRDGAPTTGAMRYNTTSSVWEGWDGDSWAAFGVDVPGGGGAASNITFTPSGSISANNVQAAISELDTETVKKTSSTGSAQMPFGTTAQRDGAPPAASMRFNVDVQGWEFWNGSAWTAWGAGISGVTAVSTVNTPAGNIASTNVQGAINELDTEKVAKAGDTMTGNLLGPIANFDTFEVGRFAGASNNFYLNADGAANFALVRVGTGANVMAIASTNAAIFINDVTAFSDERRKTDWMTLDSNFVTRLADVKSGTFTRIDADDDSRHVGVSAQSLQALMPEAVLTDGDGYLSVAYGNAALAACIELAKEVKMLRARLDVVESML